MIYNPMRRPTAMIRNHILRHTPIGMYRDEAIAVVENNERWGSPVVNMWSGFIHPTLFVDGPDGLRTRAVVGDQSVQIRHRYSIPFFLDRVVRILWGFDENGKLVEVYIHSSFGT